MFYWILFLYGIVGCQLVMQSLSYSQWRGFTGIRKAVISSIGEGSLDIFSLKHVTLLTYSTYFTLLLLKKKNVMNHYSCRSVVDYIRSVDGNYHQRHGADSSNQCEGTYLETKTVSRLSLQLFEKQILATNRYEPLPST